MLLAKESQFALDFADSIASELHFLLQRIPGIRIRGDAALLRINILLRNPNCASAKENGENQQQRTSVGRANALHGFNSRGLGSGGQFYPNLQSLGTLNERRSCANIAANFPRPPPSFQSGGDMKAR